MHYPLLRPWTVCLSALLLLGMVQTAPAANAETKTKTEKTKTEAKADPSKDRYNKAINDFNAATLTFDPAKIKSTIAELQVVASDPLYQNDATVHNLLGYLYLTRNDPASAIPELQTTVRLKPDNLEARNNLGNALRQTNRYDEAAAQYQYVLDHPAAKGGPDPNRIKFNLATVLGQAGKLDQSLALFAALTATDTPAAMDSTHAPVYKNYGFFLQKAGRTAEAAEALNNASLLDIKDASVALNAGELYAKVGQYDNAIAALTRALTSETEPKLDAASQYDAHFTLGEAYAAKGDSGNGMTEFTAVAALQPQNAVPLYNRGVLEEQSGLNSEAEASYRSALQCDSSNSQIQLALGLLLANVGGHDAEATTLLASAAPKLPQDAKAAPVYARLGDLYAAQNNIAQANLARRQALALAPNDADTRVALADSYMTQHQYVAALAEYNQAALARPTDAAIQNQRGVAYKNLRQYPKALAAFQKAAALSPSNAQVQNNLGVLYELLGRRSAAIVSYKKALALNPQLAEARRNLSRFAVQ